MIINEYTISLGGTTKISVPGAFNFLAIHLEETWINIHLLVFDPKEKENDIEIVCVKCCVEFEKENLHYLGHVKVQTSWSSTDYHVFMRENPYYLGKAL